MAALEKTLLQTYYDAHPNPVAGLESFQAFVDSLPLLFERHGRRSWTGQKKQHRFQIQLQQPQLAASTQSLEETYKMRSSYTAPITAELSLSRNEKLLCTQRVTVCEIPAMVQPKGRDLGGYFIVHGTDRIIITQQNACKMPWQVRYSGSKKEHYINSGRSNVKLTMRSHGPIFVTKLGSFNKSPEKTQLPLALLFLALGVTSVEEALRLCVITPLSAPHQQQLQQLLQQSWNSIPEKAQTQSVALQQLASLWGCKESSTGALEYATQQLTWNCFPTYGKLFPAKAAALGMMTFQLVCCSLGITSMEDPHHIGRKRYDRVGNMLHKMFRDALRNLLVGTAKRIDALQQHGKLKPSQLSKLEPQSLLNVEYITNILCSALGSGRILQYEGISQVYNRMNRNSEISHQSTIQRVIPSKAEKITELRSYDMKTAPGFIDPHHTPDGGKCALIIQPTMLTKFSKAHSAYQLMETLRTLCCPFFRSIEDTPLPTTDPILYVNGVWKGTLYHKSVDEVLQMLKQARDQGALPHDCSLYCLKQELYVWCDENRLLRPLARLPIQQDKLTSLTWSELVHQGHIQYVCPFEAEQLCIAQSWRHAVEGEHTHCELAGLALMSYSSAKVAYGNRNPACRITYFSAQGKQAVASRLPVGELRWSENQPRQLAVHGDYHELWYAQKPLAASCIDAVRGAEEEEQEGCNAVVMVGCYYGYNTEDAIILCKAPLDRGMYRSFYYKGYRMEEDEGGRLRICYHAEDLPVGEDYFGYGDKSALGVGGLPSPGTYIKEGQAVIGAVMERDGRLKDASLLMKQGNEGVVQEAVLTELPKRSQQKKSHHAASVVVRSTRVPQMGDKFSSRHGQKGVVGMVYPPEDMPFSPEGIVPDIIINPHAAPTRMTTAQFIESLVALSTCFSGYFFDATPLQAELDGYTEKLRAELSAEARRQLDTEVRDRAVDILLRGLKRGQVQSLGDVMMYNGMTGELMEKPLFMGPVYYQRLKHQVQDKRHARARGPRNLTTRQPTEGRSKGGAIRFGEMERDGMIGSGTVIMLNDRLTDNSDKHTAIICKSCGIFGTVEMTSPGEFRCRDKRCVGQTIVKAVIPYGLELFFKELISMNITPCVLLEPSSTSSLLVY